MTVEILGTGKIHIEPNMKISTKHVPIYYFNTEVTMLYLTQALKIYKYIRTIMLNSYLGISQQAARNDFQLSKEKRSSPSHPELRIKKLIKRV